MTSAGTCLLLVVLSARQPSQAPPNQELFSASQGASLGAWQGGPAAAIEAAFGQESAASSANLWGHSASRAEAFVRGLARPSADARQRFQEVLAHARWQVRLAGLEALGRGLEAGTLDQPSSLARALEARVLEIALDSSAREQAAALLALARWPTQLELAREPWTCAAGHALPDVRVATVRCLARHAAPWAGPVLLALASDPDARVHALARAALCMHESYVDEARSFALQAAGNDEVAWMEFALAFERSGRPPRSLANLSRELELLGSTNPAVPAARGVWEAMALAAGEEGDPALIQVAWPRQPPEPEAPLFEGSPLFASRQRQRQAALERERLLWRCLRAVGARDHARATELSERLFASAAQAASDADGASFLTGFAEIGQFDRLAGLEREHGLKASRAEFLWTLLATRPVPLHLEMAKPWLARDEQPQVRAAVYAAASANFDAGRNLGCGQILRAGLEDLRPELRSAAFRSLCSAGDLAPWSAALFEAWTRQESSLRSQWLEYLPRSVALSDFRGKLLQLASDPARRFEVLELLCAFHGDAEIASLCARWLREELQQLKRSGPLALREHELRACQAVRAARQTGAEKSVPVLIEALEASHERSIEVGKVVVAALAGFKSGRSELSEWLSDEIALRVRVEAALALAAREGEAGIQRARAVLRRDMARCDFELSTRILRCLAAAGDEDSADFLESVALDSKAELELRMVATDALAAHEPTAEDVLWSLASGADQAELRAAALQALAKVGGERAEELLLDRLEALQRGPAPLARSPGEPWLEYEREQIFLALAELGSCAERLRSAWLVRPVDAWQSEWMGRIEGRRLGSVEFSYRGELALAEPLARSGLLRVALEQSREWWLCDARFLHALAERVLPESAADARLFSGASLVAQGGEGKSEDGAKARLAAQAGSFLCCWRLEDWSGAAEHARNVLLDWRLGLWSERDFAQQFGNFDPAKASDPQADLESAELQAKALQAHRAGDLEAAALWTHEAKLRLGFSRQAAMRQKRLEAYR